MILTKVFNIKRTEPGEKLLSDLIAELVLIFLHLSHVEVLLDQVLVLVLLLFHHLGLGAETLLERKRLSIKKLLIQTEMFFIFSVLMQVLLVYEVLPTNMLD